MSQPELIDALVREIKKQLRSGELIEAGENLKKLRRRKLSDELRLELANLETRYHELVDKRADELRERIQDTLQKTRQVLDAGNLPRDDFADEIQSALDELEALKRSKDQIPGWKEELRRLMRAHSDLTKVTILEQEVNALWEQARKTEQDRGNPEQIIEMVKEALEKVRGFADKERIVSPEPKRRLGILISGAERRLRDVEERHKHTPTRQAGEEVVTQLKLFCKMPPDTLITYAESEVPGAPSVVQEVSKAIPIARHKVLQFWHSKVQEYTDLARKALDDDHDPYAATRLLQKCSELPGLNDPEVGLALGGDAQILINNLEQPIKEALQARQTTTSLCEQSLEETNLVEAYKLFRQAIATDRFAPAVTKTRTLLQQRLIHRTSEHLTRAEEWLSEGAWTRVRNLLTQVNDLLALDPEASTGSVAEHVQQIQRVLDDVETLRTDVSTARDPTIAKAYLDKFIERYTEERVQRWMDIRQLRDTVEAQLNAQAVIARFRARIGPQATLEQLEDALEDWEQERLQISEQYRDEFDALKPLLDAWLGYQRAVSKRESDLAGALAALTPALTFQDDSRLRERAEVLRHELEQQKSSTEKAAQAVEEIRQLISTQPRKAWENARQWKSGKTFYTSEFVRLEQQARERWEQDVVTTLERFLSQRPLELNTIKQIRAGLNDLQTMHSEHEADYRARAEVPCAVGEAELLERSTPPYGNTSWQQVVSAWENAYQKAMQYAPTEAPHYWQRRLAALKRQYREQARKVTPSQQIDLYSQLNDEFDESDAEVWLWLGQAYLQAAKELVQTYTSEPQS